MRTSEERIAELHRRAGAMQRERIRRRMLLAGAGVFAGSAALAAALAVVVSGLDPTPAVGAEADMQASMFVSDGAAGYMVVAFAAFLLGSAATVFCYRLKRCREEKKEEERDDRAR